MSDKEFSDFVEQGVELLKERDTQAWQLGDLVVDFEVCVGRPTDPDAPTLGDLANAWDVATPRMSEWRNTSKCYPSDVRTFNLSWSHYNMARKAADGDMETALDFLCVAERLHLGVRAFKRHLDGIYFEGVWEGELPKWLQGIVPSNIELWVIFKKADTNE